MTLFLPTGGDAARMAGALRSEVTELDKDQPVAAVMSGEELMANAVAQPQLRTLLLAVFAGVALILAGIGGYGVMFSTGAHRTPEICVRTGHRALPGHPVRTVCVHGLRE